MSRHRHPGSVAPAELIVQDFREMDRKTQLATTWALERALIQLAVASHAHEGHGVFRGRRYVDTTEDTVARALGLNPDAERRQRQMWIDDVRRYAERAIEGTAPAFAVDENGLPLLGISAFRWLRVEPDDVLRGLLIGGFRDAQVWRRRAEAAYQTSIGYGQLHPVSLSRMWEAGLNGERLARDANEERVGEWRRSGIILPDGTPTGDDVQPFYVRYRTGPGASDDLAVLAAGRMYGLGAAVGAYLADAVDTLEKYVPAVADQDEEIAAMIRDRRPELAPSDDAITYYTFISSVPPGMENTVPDSTMRHFLQRDPTLGQSLLESHFLYVMGGPWSEQPTGRHPMMNNRELYEFLEARMREFPPPA
jgi:hypothetical protein